MTIKLTPELEEAVQAIFRTGNYETEMDVLREALFLLKERDNLRHEIQLGIDELDRGEVIDAETVFKELDAKVEELLRQED